MRNQYAKAYGCMLLLGSGIMSVAVPALLWEPDVETRAFWYVLAPGWAVSPFGRDDFPQMILAVSINAIVYAAVACAIFYLAIRVARRREFL
jgi:hypothetical protein